MTENTYAFDCIRSYKEKNFEIPKNFERYFLEDGKKTVRFYKDIFESEEITKKLQKIMSVGIGNVVVTKDDENIYKSLTMIMNKINGTMLVNKKVDKANAKYSALLTELKCIKYSKTEHFVRLVEIIIDKASREANYSDVYGDICKEFSQYMITEDNEVVTFKGKLLDTCRIVFMTHMKNFKKSVKSVDNVDNVDKPININIKITKDEFPGFMLFMGNLFEKGIITMITANTCLNEIDKYMYDNNGSVMEGYENFAKSVYLSTADTGIRNSIKMRLGLYIESDKINMRSKFRMEDMMELFSK